MWLYVVALLILCVIVVLLVGKWDGAAAPREEPPAGGPSAVDNLLAQRVERDLSAADLDRVEFDTAVRGYRMDQVDQLLDALAEQLRGSATANGGSDERDRRDIPPE
ncbi:DivIVA domain-containing protein [Nesterenkonia natronophila]|uniref:DivIVA domain-containing protein n=1 Tax=Nesterenkonia natronophila TaxID=2174932 RepID=A0A3A4F8S3_9MICC|nr:DivIVA domain-containing protein [Nesterenkonia natronophila]RJN32880.1 DivIVA domain-containing protein [Nesterenkonia natronophila]